MKKDNESESNLGLSQPTYKHKMKSQISSTPSKDSTFSEKDSATTSTGGTTKKSKNGSSKHGNSDMNPDDTVLIDGCFTVDRHRWGTWQSYDQDGNGLITSLTEEACIAATRWWLKSRQEGFTEAATTYDGSVQGKL
jgi:hypothetical protein